MLYRALEGLVELLDQDLDELEKQALIERFQFVADQKENRDLAALAASIKSFLEDDSIRIAPDEETIWEEWLNRFRRWEARFFPLSRLNPVLAGVLVGLAAIALYGVVGSLVPDIASVRLQEIVNAGRLNSQEQQYLFIIRLVLQSAIGLMLLAAAGMMVLGREEAGISLGMLGLLLMLTTVNLLVFYFDQFSTILKATIELGALLAMARYRWRLERANKESHLLT
jgi:hypothetical protein